MTVAAAAAWWVRPGLEPRDGRLAIAGLDAEGLARSAGTPLNAYDLARYGETVRELQVALATAGLEHVVRFALKANREPEVLAVLRALGAPGTAESVGIDACSPGEVLLAMACGWRPEEISFTGTNVSVHCMRPVAEAVFLQRTGQARPRPSPGFPSCVPDRSSAG